MIMNTLKLWCCFVLFAKAIRTDFNLVHEMTGLRATEIFNKYHIEHMGTDTHHDQDGNVYKIHHVKRIPESEIIKD